MDDKIFRALNQFTGKYRSVDIFMIMVSKKLRYVFAFLLVIMWLQDKFHKRITSLAGISAIITLLITSLIKLIYFKPRPFSRNRVNLLAPVPSNKDSTFPSKHTTIAFSVAISVLLYKRILGYILSVLAFLSGISRIWMGQHYPSDIIGSALIGSIVAISVKFTSGIWDPFITRVIHTYNRFISLR
ncbi:undecaprenyl-diphosphatase [Neobacillus niacini]|uniref:undecaprenyl-diphosphatase n=1 Tax=Neobacillus niacini TaxID=86668 RepID=UPI0028601F73|nr:undecaprenyl-diphosphatase [Neobacillus niacini]MDR7077522.1 undecaprenyl-diphosphatase [Neobacillus niacini]